MSTLSVNTNPASFVALETLNDTNTDLSNTEKAVSTGKKVSTAADNPASFGIDQEIGGQAAGQDAVNSGLSYAASLVNTTTSAANSVIGVLKNIRNTVTSAGDTIGQSGAEDDFNKQITGYLNQIDTISRSATTNGINLLAGNKSNGYDITTTSLSYVTSLEGNTNEIHDAFSMLRKSNAINPAMVQSALGQLGGNASSLSTDKSTLSSTKSGNKPAGTINQDQQKVDADKIAQDQNTLGSDQAKHGNDSTIQSDQSNLSKDTGSLSQDMLKGAQTLTQALGLTTSGSANADAKDNFLSNVLEGNNPGSALQNSKVMNASVSMVDNAIKGMQYVTARLGENSRTINSLSSFGTKLGDSLQDAQGTLTDADMSRESAHLSSVQTKQQLAIKSLTIANGQSQSVLSLFQG